MKQQTRIDRTKPLFEFLDSYDARLVNTYTCKTPTVATKEIRLYLINNYPILVVIGQEGSWDVMVPANKGNEIDATLKAVEEFLGPRPGDGHLATLEQCNV